MATATQLWNNFHENRHTFEYHHLIVLSIVLIRHTRLRPCASLSFHSLLRDADNSGASIIFVWPKSHINM